MVMPTGVRVGTVRTVRARSALLGSVGVVSAACLISALVVGPSSPPGAAPVAPTRPAVQAVLQPASPSYATERPVTAGDYDKAPIPTGTQEYGDPDAVIIRAPDRDYGSGFHGNYGVYKRSTSPADQLRAAATDPGGCLIIGDSIATTVVSDLVRDLRQSLGAGCVYDTWPGRATEGTANALLDIKRRYGLPPKVVVMSGTNDIFNPPLFEPQLNRIVDGIGPEHQIFWVATFDSRRPYSARSAADERNTSWINTMIEERAKRTPSMRVVRWDSLFTGNGANVETLLRDGVHPNALGVEALVTMVRRSLA